MKKLFVLIISIPLIFSSCEKEEETPCNLDYGVVTNVAITGQFDLQGNTYYRITVVSPCSGVQTTRDLINSCPDVGDEYFIGWQNWN